MTHSFDKFFNQEPFSNSEYQQALVRLTLWLFSAGLMWLAVKTAYYVVDTTRYLTLYGICFFFFLAVPISIVYRPDLSYRKGVVLLIDVSAASLAMVLTSDAISPFYLIYLWICFSYGTRYGGQFLQMAILLNFSAYIGVLIYLQSWRNDGFAALFFLLLLVIIPLYQYLLLNRLHLARQEAEVAKKARGEFLATMTHELHTQLADVIGMIRLMQGTPLDMEQKGYLQSIHSSAQKLKSLTSDVLDLSKIDANKLELTPEWFDIRSLVKSISSSLAETAHDKRLELHCRIDPKLPLELFGDKPRISQILFNLLGSAVRSTDRGYVCLGLDYIEATDEFPLSHLLIEIEATGIGIRRDYQEAVFDCFRQADSAGMRRFEGAGLGATVVSDLIRLMGGRVELGGQQGEVFIFSARLPLPMREGEKKYTDEFQLEGRCILIYEQDPVARELYCMLAAGFGMKVITATHPSDFLSSLDSTVELLLICDSLGDSTLKEVLYKAHAVAPSLPFILVGYRGRMHDLCMPKDPDHTLLKPFLDREFADMAMHALGIPLNRQTSAQQAESEPDPGINILLAEDNTIAAKVLTTLLTQRGHKVRITKDGKEALQAVSDNDYELAFVDLSMPNVDGIEFARRYRKIEPKHRHMPIYALTANSVQEMFDRCLEAGMDGFLTKPVEPEMLDAIIEQCKARLKLYYSGDQFTVPT